MCFLKRDMIIWAVFIFHQEVAVMNDDGLWVKDNNDMCIKKLF